MDSIEYQLYGRKVIDNRNIKMVDAINFLLRKEEVRNLDIAVGYFYLSGLLLVKDAFIYFMDNKNGRLRVMMGNQTSNQTVKVIDGDSNNYFDYVRRFTKQDTDKISDEEFLGMISNWIKEGRIEVKVYTGNSNYFHAKSYLFANRQKSENGTAIVGSSNFSKNGLEGNTELNVLGQDVYFALHQWYSDLWLSDEVDKFSPDLIQIIKPKIFDYLSKKRYKTVKETYYDFASIYSRPYTTLNTKLEWVKNLYPHQRSGVIDIKNRLDSFGTAVLADGVGLGKTRTAAGVIKLYLSDNVRKILIVADHKLRIQWQEELAILGIDKDMYDYMSRDAFTNRSISDIDKMRYTLVVIDEAHQGFKNNNTEAYRKMKILKEDNPDIKGLLMTATPWNNRRDDVVNIGLLFINIDQIPSNREYKQYIMLGGISNKVVKQIALDDKAFRELWSDVFLQRTRKTYGGKNVHFPRREFPTISINYEPQKDQIFSDNFDTVLGLSFPYMDPIKYIDDSKEALGANQLKIMLLKRADSSWKAYRDSLKNILKKLLKLNSYVSYLKKLTNSGLLKAYKSFLATSYKLSEYDIKNFSILKIDDLEYLTNDNMDELSKMSSIRKRRYLKYMTDKINSIKLKQAKIAINNMDADTSADLEILTKLVQRLDIAYSKHDEKLETITFCIQKELKKQHKIILVSQFKTTAIYYYNEIYRKMSRDVNMGLVVGGIGSDNKINQENASKAQVLDHFSPISKNISNLYNPDFQIDLLIGTDTISTGQNLQDAVTLMNIDLPYNPMVLEQRIGRIDRPRQDDNENNRCIYIYTFPVYKSIEGQLKMSDRLGNKMKGIIDDTQFDNVVLPEYRQYLENVKKNNNNAVKDMVDSTIQHKIPSSLIDSEKHSEQYNLANKRMYDFKSNGINRVKDPIIENVSFSSGSSHSIGVFLAKYMDVNNSYLNQEEIIIDLNEMKILGVTDAESNIFNEISEDYNFNKELNINKANFIYNYYLSNVKHLKAVLIDKYNKQISEFDENSKKLIDKTSEKAAQNIIDSLKNVNEQQKIMSIIISNGVNPKDIGNMVQYIRTIDDSDEDFYPIIKDIAANVNLFWLHFSQYKEYFSGEKWKTIQRVGKNIKASNIRKANYDSTELNLEFANIVL